MGCIRITLIVIAFILSFLKGSSQTLKDTISLNLEHFDMRKGLSQGMVRCIYQDKLGYMWFATKDGLNRYDGYQMKIYRSEANKPLSLPDNYISSMLEDTQGNFWVGLTNHELYYFDRRKENFYRVRSNDSDFNMQHEGIQELLVQDEYLIVRKNKKRNLFVLDLHNFKVNSEQYESTAFLPCLFNFKKDIQLSRPFSEFGINAFKAIGKASFYLSIQSDIYRLSFNQHFRNPKLKPILTSSTFQSNSHIALSDTFDHTKIIFQNDKKIMLYDMHSNQIIYSLPFASIMFESGEPQFISPSEAIVRRNNCNYLLNIQTKQIKPIKEQHEVVNRYQDKNGTLWLGTLGFGVYRFRNLPQVFYTKLIDGRLFQNQYASCLYIEKGKTFKLNTANNEMEYLIPKQKWKSNWGTPTYITQTKQGIYWIKMQDKKSMKRIVLSYNPQNSAIREYNIIQDATGYFDFIMEDNNGNLMVVMYDSNEVSKLVYMDTLNGTIQKTYHFPVAKTINEYNFISAWHQDADNKFWFATTSGLLRFDEKKNEWKHYQMKSNNPQSLSSNILFSICPDIIASERYLWLGTGGAGLNRFDKLTGNCIRISEEEGLPNNVIYGIQTDEEQNLWLSTNKGLCCFNSRDIPLNSKNGVSNLLHFLQEDGLSDNEFNRYQSLKLKDGTLVFGGVNGLTWFHPKNVFRPSVKHRTIISGVSVFNKSIDYKNFPSIVKEAFPYVEHIQLNHDQNIFTISFAALDDSKAEKKRYKYKLEGFSNEWIDNGDKNFASFTNLNAGSYEFVVSSCSSNGQWDEEGVRLRINILPAWWATWWFRLLILLVTAAFFYTLYQYRLNQLRKVHNLRNRIAGDLHDEIGSTLSSISLSSAVIQKKANNLSPEVNKLIIQIGERTNEMMDAMSDIVWTINTKNDRFDHILERMNLFGEEIMANKDCKFSLICSEALKELKLNLIQRKNVYLIFKEAINNVAKYAEAKKVEVSLNLVSRKKIVMRIQDDGQGFDIEEESLQSKSGGNGIGNMRKRALELNAKLKLESVPGQGTILQLEMEL